MTRKTRDRIMNVCAALCAAGLVASGAGIWLAHNGLWMPIAGAVAALIGIASWAHRANEKEAS